MVGQQVFLLYHYAMKPIQHFLIARKTISIVSFYQPLTATKLKITIMIFMLRQNQLCIKCLLKDCNEVQNVTLDPRVTEFSSIDCT